MQAGLNGELDPDLAHAVAALGFTLNRFDGPAGIAAAVAAGLRPLVIVRDLAEVSRCAGLDVELLNEPDGVAFVSPADYAARVPDFVNACDAVGARPWVGSISNLHREALAWLRQMWAALPIVPPADLGVTVHRYHPPAPVIVQTPHPGFSSRAAEVAALKAIIGDRPWGMSEFGYHTAPQLRRRWLPRWWPGNSWAWTDAQVADNVRAEFAFWRAQGAAFAVLYQIRDGPNNEREHRYGISRLTDTPFDWKPVAHTAA